MEKIPVEVKYSIRKIIATHAHAMQRVKKGDKRTMHSHTMSMMDGIERLLLKHNPEIFTWKKRSLFKRFFQHVFRVKNQYSDDTYVNHVCLIMQAYRYRTDLVKAKFEFMDKPLSSEKKEAKEKHTAEAVKSLLQLT